MPLYWDQLASLNTWFQRGSPTDARNIWISTTPCVPFHSFLLLALTSTILIKRFYLNFLQEGEFGRANEWPFILYLLKGSKTYFSPQYHRLKAGFFFDIQKGPLKNQQQEQEQQIFSQQILSLTLHASTSFLFFILPYVPCTKVSIFFISPSSPRKRFHNSFTWNYKKDLIYYYYFQSYYNFRSKGYTSNWVRVFCR